MKEGTDFEKYKKLADKVEEDMKKQREKFRASPTPPPLDIRFIQRRQMNRQPRSGK